MNYWKWGVIVGLIILAFIGGCEYNRRATWKSTIVDTSTGRTVADTVYLPEITMDKPGDTIYAKSPRTVHDTAYLPGDTIYVGGYDTPQWLVDDANDWNRTRYYDTTIARNGDTIRIVDAVHKNMLLPRRIKTIWHDTMITKTIVIKPPRHYVGSFTLSGGATMDGHASAAFGFQLKNPNDRTYQIEYQRIFGTKQIFVMATISLPIHLLGKKQAH